MAPILPVRVWTRMAGGVESTRRREISGPILEDTMGNSARTPRGINHVVLNVTNLEVSHRFWTETMGFRCVAALKQEPGLPRPKMRFYSGVDSSGGVTHHDLALMEIKAPATNGGKSE